MQTEYGDKVLDFRKLRSGNHVVKFNKDDGFDDANDMKSTLRNHIGAFIISNSKRIMNNFTREINGHCNHAVHYGDTDSKFIEEKYWNVLVKLV